MAGSLRAALLSALLAVGGCTSLPAPAPAVPGLARHAVIAQVPFFPQTENQCGAAALATVLNHSGVAITPAALEPQVYVPGRKGAFQIELVAAARQAGRIAYTDTFTLTEVQRLIAAGQPLLVLQNLGLDWYPQWHFAVVVGYDLDAGEVILRSGDIADYRISARLFERTWRRAGYWGLLTLTPGQLPAADLRAQPYFQALAALESTTAVTVLPAWRQGVERWPEHSDLRMGYANALYGQQQLDEAARQYAQVLQARPDYGPAHNNLAQVRLAQGLYPEALALIDAAITRGGAFLPAYRATRQEILDAMSGPLSAPLSSGAGRTD